jgi:hypothetical protein
MKKYQSTPDKHFLPDYAKVSQFGSDNQTGASWRVLKMIEKAADGHIEQSLALAAEGAAWP